ncbi:TetR/AcrR family transcriptional regulator [Amycolatopsis acidicola]|uniref:TetR/AcrR family transcriptional regulator n=1 Tax=Amycolatopsis acidicola TaxID=2596893 RepID=A0A5N0UN52_9PSEU|nr:TetR/AcrR family transcriptional regulator [Amycolatopsis acidicola]KAA9151857.1 TetR/AcrR family transcriptional regulator [Amycolatopsis acidicola]
MSADPDREAGSISELQQRLRDAGPKTAKARERRAALVAAATRTFEREGYANTRVADIVHDAGVAHGTFYRYFESKDAIFREVVLRATADMVDELTAADADADGPEGVRPALQRFVAAYAPRAAILLQLRQAGTFSPEFRELRLELRRAFVALTARGIRALRSRDAGLDVDLVAEVLGATLDHMSFVWLGQGREFDEDVLLDTLALVWSRTLGLPGQD